jgi:hypothetical protein
MKHIIHILSGIGSVINPLGTRSEYTYPQVGDRARDFQKLAGDWDAVGTRLRNNTKEALPGNVKQSNNRQGQTSR